MILVFCLCDTKSATFSVFVLGMMPGIIKEIRWSFSMNKPSDTQLSNQALPFKLFPEFTKLTFENREEYKKFIAKYPPVSDTDFSTLKLWWDDLDNAQASILNGNLVVAYWHHGDEELSGLSLVGTNKIDQSICTIFDFLREQGRRVRLINVPEFVIQNIDYPEMFNFDASLRDDEYILDVGRFADIKKMSVYQRAKIKRFIKELSASNVTAVEVDLSKPENRLKLIESASRWPKKGFNAIGSVETEIMTYAITEFKELGIRNVCLMIDGELQAYVLYNVMHDNCHVIAHHARINYDINGLFEYLTHAFCRELQKDNIKFINIHSDIGLLRLRALKIALRPAGYIHKFVIEPGERS